MYSFQSKENYQVKLFHNDKEVNSSRRYYKFYVFNNRAMKHVKQKLRELQKEIGKATITVGALSTLSSVTDEQVDRKLVLAQSTNLT